MKKYILTFGFDIHDRLDEWLIYHLDILKFDRAIIVECFDQVADHTEDTDIKKICDKYGDRVIYDFIFIREPHCPENMRTEWWHDHVRSLARPPLVKKDPFVRDQLFVTQRWIDRLLEMEPKDQHANTWLYYTDVDEFLNLNKLTIHEFIDKHSEDWAGIGFMQHIFSHNNIQTHNPDSLIIDTHRKSIKYPYHNRWTEVHKTIHRLDRISKFKRGWTHHVEYQEVIKDNGAISHGRNIGFCKTQILKVPLDVANINHYKYKDKDNISNTKGNGYQSLQKMFDQYCMEMARNLKKIYPDKQTKYTEMSDEQIASIPGDSHREKICNMIIAYESTDSSKLWEYADRIRSNENFKKC